MTAEWKARVENHWLLNAQPGRLLVVEKIRFTPAALVDRLQLNNQMLAASVRSGYSPGRSLPCIVEQPLAELSIGKEFFVTPAECVSIFFHEKYTGEVEFVCHEPVLSPARGEADMPLRKHLVGLAMEQVRKLTLPEGYRAVVIVTDDMGDYVGVSSNAPSDQAAIIWCAAHGEDPVSHGPK
jgi:hypothetical protein